MALRGKTGTSTVPVQLSRGNGRYDLTDEEIAEAKKHNAELKRKKLARKLVCDGMVPEPEPAPAPPTPEETAWLEVERLTVKLNEAEMKAANARAELTAATRRLHKLEILALLKAAGFENREFTREDVVALGVSKGKMTTFFNNNKAIKELTKRDGETLATYKIR